MGGDFSKATQCELADCALLCDDSFVYLKHCEQALVETVKVPPGLLCQWVILKLGSKDLHPQQRKDTHEQEEEDQQGGNGLNTVGQGSHQVREGLPIPIM